MKTLLSAVALSFFMNVNAQEMAKVFPPVLVGCEQMEVYADCENCFFRHLLTAVMQELVWPEGLETEGKVFAEVVYNETAELERVTIKRSYSPLASKEVERTLKAIDLPKSPAYQGDKPVKVSYVLPVSFKR